MADITFRIERRDDGRARLVVDCQRATEGECRFSLWREAAVGVTWHWDGNEACPTISPSINCHPCARHFSIVAGKVV